METITITSANGGVFELQACYLLAGWQVLLNSADLMFPSVFRDMFSVKGIKPGKEPILIDAPTNVVNIFLSMLGNKYEYYEDEMDVGELLDKDIVTALCDLSDKYESPKIKADLRACLSRGSFNIEGWQLLTIACRVDGLEMAKYALGQLDTYDLSVAAIWDSSLTDEWKKALL